MNRRKFLETAAAMGGACLVKACGTPASREQPFSSEPPRETCERILHLSSADETQVQVFRTRNSVTRFAENSIHQNVTEGAGAAEVVLVVAGSVARVVTNRLDEVSIRSALREGVERARRQKPVPDFLSMPGPNAIRAVSRFDLATREASPEERAEAVSRTLAAALGASVTAAGLLETGSTETALANSRGLTAFHRETQANFSLTVLSEDSSGWAQGAAYRLADLDVGGMTRRAIEKAQRARRPGAADPGRYTVVLEPAAVADLVTFLLPAFDARLVEERRSCFVGKLGQPVFGPNVTILDDVHDVRQSGAPFDGEGVAKRRLCLVEDGVLRTLVRDRATARKTGAGATGHGSGPPEYGARPSNVVFRGGTEIRDELIRGLARGILITHFWYVRSNDPFRLTVTGMTRDGTFLIENGALTRGLRNMRFNVAVPEMLRGVEAMSPEESASGIESPSGLYPALRVRDFNFTSLAP